MHLTNRANNLVLLVIFKLFPVDPVRPVLLPPIQHDSDIMQRHLSIRTLDRLGRMNRINRPALNRLRISDVVGLPPDIDPQLLRQISQVPVRPIMRISEK